MSTPKPRVWWDTDLRMWREECACGCAGRSGDWRRVIDGALEHSRTHTAERIADELDRLSGNALDKAELGSRFSGVAYAFAKSSVLIREHLVKETP